MELTAAARAEIARLIAEGFTSGLLAGETGERIAWSLEYDFPDRRD
jgi:hypothetical protein